MIPVQQQFPHLLPENQRCNDQQRSKKGAQVVEKSSAETEQIEADISCKIPLFFQLEKTQHRQQYRQRIDHVNCRIASTEEKPCAAQKEPATDAGDLFSEKFPPQETQCVKRPQSGDHTWEPQSELRKPQQLHKGQSHPVAQHSLFRKDLPVQRRMKPVAADQHFTGDLSIDHLVFPVEGSPQKNTKQYRSSAPENALLSEKEPAAQCGTS